MFFDPYFERVDRQFEIVPLAEVPGFHPEAPPKPCPPLVLVVDDEALVADTVSAVLSRSGLAAIPAYGGVDALDLARLLGPELLLTDLAMPDLDGLELARRVTVRLIDCKVLLFSGHMLADELLRSLRDGEHYELVYKPIDPRELIRRVKQCLSGHMGFSASNLSRDSELLPLPNSPQRQR